jgi:hypothetical protein
MRLTYLAYLFTNVVTYFERLQSSCTASAQDVWERASVSALRERENSPPGQGKRGDCVTQAPRMRSHRAFVFDFATTDSISPSRRFLLSRPSYLARVPMLIW